MKTKQRPKFIWKKSTENRHVAYVGDGASISVERHRSWRTVNSTRPWMIDVLGHRCSHLVYGASFEEAQLTAEKEYLRVLKSMKRRAFMSSLAPPSKLSVEPASPKAQFKEVEKHLLEWEKSFEGTTVCMAVRKLIADTREMAQARRKAAVE